MIPPLVIAVIILVLDQVSKALIVAATDNRFPTLIASFVGDFLHIRHDRNLGIAFGGFSDLEGLPRFIVVILLPIIIVACAFWVYFRDKSMNDVQRSALALILGGGVGNIIDRVFRSEGVVDFLSFRVFGFLGMERWPTFNVADASLVVGGILILLGSLVRKKDTA